LQQLIEHAAVSGAPVRLPSGVFHCRTLRLRANARLIGTGASTVLRSLDGNPILAADKAGDVSVEDMVLDGGHLAAKTGGATSLAQFADCARLRLDRLHVTNGRGSGITLVRSSGDITSCRIAHVADAGLHALDCLELRVSGNDIADCGNNGIQIWRSTSSIDGTIVSGNRIARIRADSGGNGQNGNGINIFRADAVAIADNHISECAYSAIRGNAASDIRVTANTCLNVGEVAIYAEFGFEGALIANNLIDRAATGISVTNFNVGGRLAVVQGNLIRNLVRREHEPDDKRGDGIFVEADASVTGNTIENAQTAGIVVGWGKFLRDCVVSANLVRKARIGILVSADPAGGAMFVTGNMISGAKDGAIRGMMMGQPTGDDLAQTTTRTARVNISGNMAAG
jgi:uncharacterized secreted repeat protein (TIGR03808 family)